MIRVLETGILATDQVKPSTNNILNILLPTIFPIAISDCFLSEAIIEVTNSGAEVPKATIVRPIIDSGTLKERAIFLADPTNKSAHIPKPISHTKMKINDFETLWAWASSSSHFSCFHHFASPKVYAKKSINNNKNTKLSHLSITFVVAPEKNVSNARKNKASDAIRENGTSLYMVELWAFSGYTSAATQSTSQVFAIFDPITFHKANSVCHFNAESIFTNSSGAEVPKATIVRPITSWEIPNLLARDQAPLTKTSAHLMSTINQITKYI